MRLRIAIDMAILKGNGSSSAFTLDGEGYTIFVMNRDNFDLLKLPYSNGIWDGVHPGGFVPKEIAKELNKSAWKKDMKYTIYPYVSQWGSHRVWVFDDPTKGLINEGLVSGTDLIMDHLSAPFKDGEKGFKLTFSDEPFDGYQMDFEWVRSDSGEDLADGVGGNWYRSEGINFEGWLCPALFKYFDTAPKHIYAKAEPLDVELIKGVGPFTIQDK